MLLQVMCVVSSLMSTCRNHDVNPREYLNDIISRMPYMEKASHEQLVELLPHKPKSVIRISLCRTAKRNPLIFPI